MCQLHAAESRAWCKPVQKLSQKATLELAGRTLLVTVSSKLCRFSALSESSEPYTANLGGTTGR